MEAQYYEDKRQAGNWQKSSPLNDYVKVFLFALFFIGIVVMLQWGLMDYRTVPHFSDNQALRKALDQQQPLMLHYKLLLEIVLGMLLFRVLTPLRKDGFKIIWQYGVMALCVFLITAFLITVTMFSMFGGIPLIPLLFLLSSGTSAALNLYTGMAAMSFIWGKSSPLDGKERWTKMILAYVIIFVLMAIAWNVTNMLRNTMVTDYSGLAAALIYILAVAAAGTVMTWMLVPFRKTNFHLKLPYLITGAGLLILEILLIILFGTGILPHSLFSLFFFQESVEVMLSALFGVLLIQGFYQI